MTDTTPDPPTLDQQIAATQRSLRGLTAQRRQQEAATSLKALERARETAPADTVVARSVEQAHQVVGQVPEAAAGLPTPPDQLNLAESATVVLDARDPNTEEQRVSRSDQSEAGGFSRDDSTRAVREFQPADQAQQPPTTPPPQHQAPRSSAPAQAAFAHGFQTAAGNRGPLQIDLTRRRG